MLTLSSTKFEYIGLSIAGQHLQWLHMLLEEVGCPQSLPTTLYCDNQVKIIFCKELQFHAQMKHIQCKYYYVCDNLVAKSEHEIKYISTSEMVADILLKAPLHGKH